jgi:cysteine desulfurase
MKLAKRVMAQNKHISYLDYNATTPVRPEAAGAVADCLATFGNPSSVHQVGRKARAAVESARDAVASVVGARASSLIFTSGGTEANALALRGLKSQNSCGSILASAVEHPSVLAHVNKADHIPVSGSGQVDLNALEDMLKARRQPVLISLMFANNETGVLQPVAEAVQLAKTYGALVHCDAVQAPGKVQVDFEDLELDAMSLSAHKFGGLKGAGALVLRDGLSVIPDIPGGGQERGHRAGTENVVGIVALGAAAACIGNADSIVDRVKFLRERLEIEIQKKVPHAKVVGSDVERLGNTCCVIAPGISNEIQLMKLDLANIAVGAGSACSSGKIAPSHVLLAMGVNPTDAKCAIRLSFGWDNTDVDVDRFLQAWVPLINDRAAQ